MSLLPSAGEFALSTTATPVVRFFRGRQRTLPLQPTLSNPSVVAVVTAKEKAFIDQIPGGIKDGQTDFQQLLS